MPSLQSTLKKISWRITEEDIGSPILGKRVLESLECVNREMLLAIKGRYGDDIDVACFIKQYKNEEGCERKIVALFGESVLHNGGQIEDDGLHDEDMNVA